MFPVHPSSLLFVLLCPVSYSLYCVPFKSLCLPHKPFLPLSPSHSFHPCPSASAYFHIPELIPLSPRLQPVVFPVSLLIRLSLALVLLIPEGFVYLCWSCFYSLRLTPPIFSPVI